MTGINGGYLYGAPFANGKNHFPQYEERLHKSSTSTLTNPDAVSKMQKVNAACQELDLLRDVARLLDSAPVDVQERVAAWIFAKYGKSVPVTVPAPSPAPTWPSPTWPPNTVVMYGAPGLQDGEWSRKMYGGLLGGPIGGTFTGSLGSAVADGFPVADVHSDADVAPQKWNSIFEQDPRQIMYPHGAVHRDDIEAVKKAQAQHA